MISPSRQSGAALLSILLIVATLSVAALIATQAIARQTELQRLGSRRSMANWAAYSAEAAALVSANDMVNASRLPAAGDGEARVRTVVLPLDGGQIVLNLREVGPCLNLNALANPDERVRQQQSTALATLLEDVGVSTGDVASLVATLTDWIDADATEQPGGAEDGYYTSQQAGFRAANQRLRSLNELAPLPGYSPEVRQSIASYTCVLNDAEPLALNFNALTPASAYLLRAETSGALSLAEARRFIEGRPELGWSSIDEVQKHVASRPELQEAFAGLPIAVRGSHFAGDGRVDLDAGSWPFRFILSTGSSGPPRVVWRSFGEAG